VEKRRVGKCSSKRANSRFEFVTKHNILPNSKRSQAAMEFLMTYGWAIMAAVIAIGVLAYFGVFSPGKYVTGNAIVTTPFYANAWNVKDMGVAGTDTVTIELKNNGREEYSVQSITLSDTPSAVCDVTGMNGTGAWDIPMGASQAVTLNCTGGDLSAGDNFKGDITIAYRKSGSSIDLTSTGTISEKVTA